MPRTELVKSSIQGILFILFLKERERDHRIAQFYDICLVVVVAEDEIAWHLRVVGSDGKRLFL